MKAIIKSATGMTTVDIDNLPREGDFVSLEGNTSRVDRIIHRTNPVVDEPVVCIVVTGQYIEDFFSGVPGGENPPA